MILVNIIEKTTVFADESGKVFGICRHTKDGYAIATLENQKLTPDGRLDIDPDKVCYSPFVACSLEQVMVLFKKLAGDTCEERASYPCCKEAA